MVIKFKKAEIDYLKKSLSDQQQAIGMLEFFSTVTEKYEELEYPITSFSDFIKKLSKEESPIKKLSEEEISVGNGVLKIDCLRRLIPAYYFPISNNEDLEDKANELSSKKISQFNLNESSPTIESQLPKAEQIPAEKLPPFPDEFKNINNKSKERQLS